MPPTIATPTLRVTTDSPARTPTRAANGSRPLARMALSASSAAASAKSINSESLITEPLTIRKTGRLAHTATIATAGQSPTPLNLRSISNATTRNPQLNSAVRQTLGPRLAGNDGSHFQIQESSQG